MGYDVYLLQEFENKLNTIFKTVKNLKILRLMSCDDKQKRGVIHFITNKPILTYAEGSKFYHEIIVARCERVKKDNFIKHKFENLKFVKWYFEELVVITEFSWGS